MGTIQPCPPGVCWRCQSAPTREALSIHCADCEREIDEVAAWRLFFWQVFGLARRPGWNERAKEAKR